MWTGWWFGIFFLFPYIGNVIIPTDFHSIIFQRDSLIIPPTSGYFIDGIATHHHDPRSLTSPSSTRDMVSCDLGIPGVPNRRSNDWMMTGGTSMT